MFDTGKVSLRKVSGTTIVGLLVVAMLITPILLLVPSVKAQPTEVLTPKWTRSGLGTNWEGGLVIGDVTGDGQEDVVYAGGGSNIIHVLNGVDGAPITSFSINAIGTFCQPQLYDVDGDGVLDILLPLYYPAGLAALRYNSGTNTLSRIFPDVDFPESSIMAKPVAGDIDNDGHLDIFLAAADVAPESGYDGRIYRIDYQGNIIAESFSWRACSGGLSLADADNDGRFEIYQGDRDMDYRDGGYGKGVKSYWADDLSERWIRLDDLTSSQAPVLADVNGDGIKDALAGMYRCVWILNSTNGKVIKYWGGRQSAISDHYGFTIYDIDGDGNLELLTCDGDHDNDPYTDVFDLVTGEMDAQLSMGPGVWDPEANRGEGGYVGGDWKWSPLVADIDPTHPGMEIISCPNGTGLDGGDIWHGTIMIWSSDYESLQNITRAPGSTPGTYSSTRLGSQLGYPFVQDIDNDGLLELVTHASSGTIYAFDTEAPAPGYNEEELPGTERVRSEVTYFGEARLGVAEHTILPWEPDYWTAPLVAPIYPADNVLAVPVSTTQLSFQLREHQNESITYNVTTSPGVGTASGSNSSISYDWSTYYLDLNTTLEYDTTYMWTVTADDGSEVTSRTYTFRTELEPNEDNNPPEQGDPLLESTDGLNTTTSTFVAYNQSTIDLDGENVTNIYNWMINGESVAQLHLPFDVRNETSTKDYANGNDGEVIGATWVPDGIVGGAYSFDGKDDAIKISDGGAGYFNGQNSPDNHRELGGYGDWDEITVGAWIYLTEDNDGSRIVAKIPSYALGFESESTNRLYCAVWPYTGEIADDENAASVDSMARIGTNVDIDLNTWNHIAFTYEMGVGLKLYFNGELVAQGSTIEGPLSPSRGEPVYIGRLVQPFAGMIDDVRIYSYAQSEEQIFNYYMDFVNGTSNSSTFIPTGVGGAGDMLGCEIIPTDTYDEGTTASASIELQNTPPSATNLEIYPIRDRAFRLNDEDLTAGYEYFDPDDDAEAASKIEWFLNGVSQPAFENLTVIPAVSTAVDQEWNFTVTPQDSMGDFGAPVTSYTITVRDNAAPTTGTPDLVSSGGPPDEEDEDLIASAVGSSDTDGDSVTNIYRWTLEGTSMANLLMPFDVETPQYFAANGTTADYSGYGNDGTVVGARWVEDGVVGGAFSFDGDDFIRVDEVGSSLGGDGGWSEISVEFWVKATGTTGTASVVSKHDVDFSLGGWQGGSYGLGYRADFRAQSNRDEFYWYVYNDTGSASVQFYDNDNVGEWHHVVCTYESGVGLKLYVDGTEQASTAFTGNINATLDGILDISSYQSSGGYGGGPGGYGGGGVGGFSGLLDEVRIYSFTLSSAQIFQRYIETKDGLSDSSTIVYHETAAEDDYAVQVIPSDSWVAGTAMDSANLHVVEATGNGQPRIDWYSPADTTPEVNEGEDLDFMHLSSDPDNDTLIYSWTLDSVEQSTEMDWTYTPDYASQGLHTVGILVNDTLLTDYQEWTVNVTDVEVRNLTVLSTVHGTTDPAPGIYPIGLNTNTTVLAIPDVAYELDHWELNGSDYGSDNLVEVNMTDNYELEPFFAEGQYNLTINIVGNGTVTPVPDQATYDYGTNVTLTADPDEDWLFIGWSGDASGSELVTTVNMTDDKTVTATFAEIEYFTLTVNVEGSGTVTVDPDQPDYIVGTVVNLTAVADFGWVFDSWSGDASGSELEIEVTMDANKTVNATFLPLLSLEIVVDGEGTTDPVAGTYEYPQGTEVEVDAIPNEGFMLSQWLLNGSDAGDADPYTVTMDADYVLTAVFVSSTLFTDCFESGNFSLWDGVTTTSGETASIVSNLTYQGSFGARFTTDGGGGTERAYLYKNFDSHSELYVRAYFNIQEGLPLDATDNRFNLISFMNGGGSSGYPIANFGVRRTGGTDYWYILGVAGTFYASSGPSMDQWYCVEFYVNVNSTGGIYRAWVDGVLVLEETGLNTASQGDVDAVRCELVFVSGVAHVLDVYSDCVAISENYIGPKELEYYTLTVNVEGNGTVDLNATGPYAEGTAVELTAIPDADWKFDGWSGDLGGDANPETIIMDSNKTVNATFTEIVYYTLTVNVVGSGTVDLNATGPYAAGTAVELTAIPNPDWKFDGWSVDLSGDANPETIIIDSNKIVNATFTEIMYYTLTVNIEGSGTVDLNATGPYVEGTAVELTAIPDVDWEFDGWSVDLGGDANPETIIMDSNKTVNATFTEIVYYTLTVNVEGSGTVNLNATGPYVEGTAVELTAVPDADWKFTGWSEDLGGDVNPETIVMDSNKTVNATFAEIEYYTLTVNIEGSGSVDLNATGPYAEGTAVELTAIPDVDWKFSGWSVDLGGDANPETIIMDSNKTVNATFTEIVYYTLTVNIEGSGIVGMNATGPYAEGTAVELTAIPNPHWKFAGWSEDLSGDANPETIIMDSNKTVNATFEILYYTLTVNIVGSGTVDLNATGPYAAGTAVELTAIPDTHWKFVGWSVDLGGDVNPETIIMDGNKTVNATFEILYYTLTVNIEGSGTVDLNATGPYAAGTAVELTAIPDTYWEFAGWSVDLSGDANPETIIMDGNKTVNATFELPYYTLTVNIEGSGTVDLNATGPYAAGTAVELTAIPDVDWKFVGWSVDLGGDANPETIIMDSNKTVNATFTEIPYYTLTVNVVGSGSVDLNATGPYAEGTAVELTAIPDFDWEFAGWSVDLGGDVNPETIVMDSNKTVNATFTAIEYLTVEGVMSWYWSDTEITSTVEADVDGDGAVEIVTAGYYHDDTRDVAQLIVWNGTTLEVENIAVWYLTGDTRINSVAVGDVDGDTDLEIVTGGYFNDGFRDVAQLIVWDGETLSVEKLTSWYWTGDTRINSVAIGDVDGDGADEIVTGGYYTNPVKMAQLIVWNGTSMAVENLAAWYWGADTVINSVAIGNVYADGGVEIVTGGYYHDSTRDVAQLVVWDGATLAVDTLTLWYWTGDTRINSVAIGDVDGDGADEIVTGGYYTDGVKMAQLIVWNGTSMAVENLAAWYWTADTEIKSVAIGNVDGDGAVEIVTGGYFNDGVRDVAQLIVWDGETLSVEKLTSWYWTGDTCINSVAVGNVDADGTEEIVTAGCHDDGTILNAQFIVWTITAH